jgi:carboxypeptidase Taq
MNMTHEKLKALDAKLEKYFDLNMVGSLLSWDESVFMPDKGAVGRGRQNALIGSLALEILANPTIADELQLGMESSHATSLQKKHYKYALKQHKIATVIPQDFYNDMQILHSELFAVWQKAKKAKDFNAVEPLLTKNLTFSRKYSEYLSKAYPNAAHPMDALIENTDEGMTHSSVKALFDALQPELVALSKKNALKEKRPKLKMFVPTNLQTKFCEWIVEQLGFEKSWGRQDISAHPFMTRLSKNDIRITTRFDENDFTESIFSSIHETGHAFYEIGIAEELDGTLLSTGVSTGVHESQSRLWENLVGRSKEFWEFAFPELKKTFGKHAENLTLEDFLFHINSSQPSLVRTAADELTYSLHVMIRFKLEAALLEGRLQIKDIPNAWNDTYEEFLGVRASSVDEGCMQDVHWFASNIGGHFQGYAIGNIMSAQIFNAAQTALPQLKKEIQQGQFLNLKNWLHKNIHTYGAEFSPNELILKCTSKPLHTKDYLSYLSEKFC